MTGANKSFLDQVSGDHNGSQTGTVQNHKHEFLGTKWAKEGDYMRNHRFSGVTSETTLIPGAPPWLIYSSSNY